MSNFTAPPSVPPNDYRNGSGVFRSNMPVWTVANTTTAIAATGVMASYAINLYAGDVVTNISFVSGGTASSATTHWWFALYDTQSTPALIAQTADQTSTAWGASTLKTLAVTTPYQVTTGGVYYISVSVTGTTVPTMQGMTVNTLGGAGYVNQKALAQTSGSAVGATAPATITSASNVQAVPYCFVT